MSANPSLGKRVSRKIVPNGTNGVRSCYIVHCECFVNETGRPRSSVYSTPTCTSLFRCVECNRSLHIDDAHALPAQVAVLDVEGFWLNMAVECPLNDYSIAYLPEKDDRSGLPGTCAETRQDCIFTNCPRLGENSNGNSV